MHGRRATILSIATMMNTRDSNLSIEVLPPGFRFHPSDQELITHYLRNKVTSSPLPASVIAEVDLYQFDPWELPQKALFGEDEWYFFTPRDRKYPNGARPNRAAASGYWKATGIDKPIFASCEAKNIGVKKALVFYSGRPPRGVKTDWIMHEYRLLDAATTWKQKGSMRLDDWVLCRVRKKSIITRSKWEDLSPNHQLAEDGYLQKPKGSRCLDKEPNPQLYKDYINNCPLLPYLLDSPKFPLIETDSSMGSAITSHQPTTDNEISRSSLDNLLDLLKECSGEANSVSGTVISFHQGKSTCIDSSDAERFLCTENPGYMMKDAEFFKSHVTDDDVNHTGTNQSQFFQNIRSVDQWDPNF